VKTRLLPAEDTVTRARMNTARECAEIARLCAAASQPRLAGQFISGGTPLRAVQRRLAELGTHNVSAPGGAAPDDIRAAIAASGRPWT
jgi:hypothetical protein